MDTKHNASFENPVLNSPYEQSTRHWEMKENLPTSEIVQVCCQCGVDC